MVITSLNKKLKPFWEGDLKSKKLVEGLKCEPVPNFHLSAPF